MTDPSIRPMTALDVERVQGVERSAGELFRSFPEPRIAACADHPPMPVSVLSEVVEQGLGWVVTDEDQVVGFVVVRAGDRAVHVEELAVAPTHGRRGLATALLDHVGAWAVEHDVGAVTLTTFRDVPWNRPFYEQRGFRAVADHELTPAQDALLREEDEQYGLARELRVFMVKDVPAR